MSVLGHWRPALRMARRDLRRHRVRALLTCLLVAIPVVVATVASLASYNSRWDREQEARMTMGVADADVVISPFAAVRPEPALWNEARPAAYTRVEGRREPMRRPRTDVDLTALLPAGSDVTAWFGSRQVALATGGTGVVTFRDLASPLSEPFVELTAGRLPSGVDEVAVPGVVADELGMLADGKPRDDAEVVLDDGSRLDVVGVLDSHEYSEGGELTMAASLDSRLRAKAEPTRFLVDLPTMTRAELKDVVAGLNAAGVTAMPRDTMLNPEAWGQEDYTSGIEVEHLVVGGFVILVGLLEVVLVVGAAFAVAARRQVRDLGLLSANGGAAADVRRVLLAQGAVLGLGSSLVGVGIGVVAFTQLVPFWELLLGTEMWREEVDWVAVGLIAVLGSLTAVVAALLPGWSMSRLTPVSALAGRFPIRTGEARAHRAAFVLAGSGLALLALGGWLTARTFGPRGSEVTLAPFLAGLGLVVLVVGAIWATPYVVRRVARLGQGLSLSGRYAFRDAARHRFRSAAATMALTITVAGAVLAGFAFSSASAYAETEEGGLPPNTMEIYTSMPSASDQQVEAVLGTLEGVVGTVEAQITYSVRPEGRRHGYASLGRNGPELRVADEATVSRLVRGDRARLAAFRDGAAVLVGSAGGRQQEATGKVVVHSNSGRRELQSGTVPLVRAEPTSGWAGNGSLGSVLVSEQTAARMGLLRGGATIVATASDPFSRDDLDRLAVYGIVGWSPDPDRLLAERMQFAGLGFAGLLSVLVVGVAVALAAAESRDDVATLVAVGAGPWRRRSMGAMHGLFLGVVGSVLGVVVGVPGGMALTQVDGLPGVDVPWLATLGTVAVVLLAAPLAGWVVSPSRLALTRRTA